MIGVLVSGEGTNLQALLEAGLPVVAVASNRPDARALARAQAVGELVARRAKERGVEKGVFDRGGYHYHGRVKALADAARAAGLSF